MTTTVMDHLTEGEVVRVVDRQLDSDEAARVNEHLAACAECRVVVDRAGARTQRLASLLGATDFDVPPMMLPVLDTPVVDIAQARAKRASWLMRPRLRAAAAIGLLLLGTMAIEPVRAAVTTWLRTQWERVAGPEPSQAPADEPGTVPVPLGPRIEFAHESARLSLEFVAPAAGSVLEVRRNTANTVSAEASSAGADLLVLPEGLHITSDATPDARYIVTVPASITTVIVSSRGRVIRRLSGSEIASGTTLLLND